ncbi:MAG: hypothetical protein K2Q20_14820 [Phycisphaerales bacterium]|nr:hypothetical protein [Phycisphaerales bacterium]
MLPSVQFWPWLLGMAAAPAEILPGVSTGAEDLYPAVPAAGMLSAGEPPVAPELALRLSVEGGPVVRRVGSAGGHAVTSATTGANPFAGAAVRVEVSWPGLTAAERDAVLEYLAEAVEYDSAGGGRFPMSVKVDGPDGPAVKLRPVGAGGSSGGGSGGGSGVERLLERVSGTAGVYAVGPIDCEVVA